jgi:type II secretory pathway component GspD/PulD (secretin)
MIPLILADEASGSLLIRARTVDYNLIEDMVKKLDTQSDLGGPRMIRVQRGIDVASLARQIEETINQGERYKQQIQKGYRGGQVKIGYEERVPALIVAGTPELYPQVERLIADLYSKTPDFGSQRTVIVPVKAIPPSDLKRILDQVIEKQTGTKQK